MPYLIDGHNLIPAIPGLHLDQLDDEMELIRLLAPFFHSINKKAIVYFDQALPASQTHIRMGNITLRFIRSPRTADDAILHDLDQLKGDAQNYIVVTSDQALGAAARATGAKVLSSRQFSHVLSGDKKKAATRQDLPNDLDYWLKVFESRKKKS